MNNRYNILANLSIKNFNYAFTRFSWPVNISDNEWWMPPELLSIYGTTYFYSLNESQLKLLSKWECINLFSININGEREVITRIAELTNKPISIDFNDYLYHFILEENQHMWWFENFCKKYAGKFYYSKNLEKENIFQDYIILAIITLARILIFEEIGHFYNINISKSKIVNSFIRDLNEAHRNDEARHITFGRQVLKDLVCKSSLLGDLALKKKVHEHLFKFLENTINSLYNPDAYKDSRIDMVFKEKGFTIRNNILSSDVRQNFNKKNFSDPIHKIFKDIGIF
ncbi:diiron oxygenase [Acinetobacter baumannii]